jgi:guanosine-3',5'-bis(diphosphate) 3'-pyrophosphohydrolase
MADDVKTIDDLIKKVLQYAPDADIELLKKAYKFSSNAHQNQKRFEGSPYIEHPLSVAEILADMHMDTASIAAGFLHDTIEDTSVTASEIKANFGGEIAFLVDSLTKLGKMELMSNSEHISDAEARAENFRKMLLGMSKDVRVILIKFADRLHNMRTLGYLPEDRMKRIAAETLEIYAPLANRLGIGWLKAELENLGFKYSYPELYLELIKKIAKRKEEQEGYLKKVVSEIENRMQDSGIHGRVSSRVKHTYGIYQKMQSQKITFEQVYDVLGIRIITDTKASCYAVMGIIHSIWTPVPGRFKDFIGVPKSNMYQSLHTTVIGPKGERVEFQIRTEEMDRIAKEGIAAHWRYKEGVFKEKDNKYIEWLRELIQTQKEFPNAIDFLEEVKGAVIPDVVYVFTPKGDIKELPDGSTPVDVAYSIHSEIGHKCVGAKVNGKIVPLKYQLKNGDTVEIITAASHTPSRDWLKYVVTQRAKSRIKQWIKTEERKQAVELGTKLLEEILRRRGLNLSIIKSEQMLEVAKSFGIETLEELIVSVGFGRVSPNQVANKLMPEKQVEDITPKTQKPQDKILNLKGITIKGVDNVLYNTAKCCFPVPGDNLIGFITKGRGVTIHNANCRNLESLTVDNARLIEVEWKQDGDATYPAKLSIEAVDKPGMLANLTALITSINVNIRSVEADSTTERRAYISFILEVKDKKQLNGLIQKITSMDGVLRVIR